jgi:hypothetical protein
MGIKGQPISSFLSILVCSYLATQRENEYYTARVGGKEGNSHLHFFARVLKERERERKKERGGSGFVQAR